MEFLTSCKTCGLVHRLEPVPVGQAAICTRCGAVIERHVSHSIARTMAFSLAALILFIPANTFPILRLQLYGVVSESTVWDSCVRLHRAGDTSIAIIVFLASIVIPLIKLTGLFLLVLSIHFNWQGGRRLRTLVYRFIETVGRWAMLDVFVLAILVSVVKLKDLATILPGPGIFAFASVVVLTLLASESFDSQLIWKNERRS